MSPPQEGHNTSRGQEAFWRLGRIQFAYDTSERTYFKDAVSRKSPGRDLKAQPRGDSRSRDFKARPRGMPSVGAAKRNLTGKTPIPHPPDRLGPGAVFKPYVYFYFFFLPFLFFIRVLSDRSCRGGERPSSARCCAPPAPPGDPGGSGTGSACPGHVWLLSRGTAP